MSERLDKIIDEKNGLKVSGMGILAENTKKMIEWFDKIQRLVYFMEKRQTQMEEQQKEMISLLKKISEKQ